jgi:dienelactone hydrolase
MLSDHLHELHEMFDQQMAEALTEDKLNVLVGPQIKALGNAENIGDPKVQPGSIVSVVTFPIHFAGGNFDVIISVDNTGKLAGLRVVPGQGPAATQTAWSPASYVDASAFHNRDVTIGTDPWKLPGTLSVPNGAGPFPAVVLVHGSGPNDRDETVGANKPFRDIADGLASRGIAVLRYDKRTKVYPQQMMALKDLTVEQETIADALVALAFLREQHEIDAQRVFLLGHSLGAYLAPRIAERDPQLAGVIMMAGTTRPIEDVMVEQYQYLGAPADQISGVKQAAAEIHALQNAAGPPLLNAPRSYWLDLNKYDPKTEVQKLHCRILVLQGGRDYQVTQVDYSEWENALKGRSNVTFHLYPSLNHLFIAGEGKSLPAEYEKPGHVSADVITDLASWMKQQ